MVGRKLTAACCPGGNSAAMRPVIGATMSQKPMMKKPASTGPSNRLSTLSTLIRDEISGSKFFKVTFFSAKNAFPAAIISQLPLTAARRTRSNKQKTCEIRSGGGTGRNGTARTAHPPRKPPYPSPRGCHTHAKKRPTNRRISPPREKTPRTVWTGTQILLYLVSLRHFIRRKAPPNRFGFGFAPPAFT